MGFQLSPGVVTSEIDLTTVVPAVATSTGAFAGKFQWGPVDIPVSISDETQLVQFFGKPDSNTAVSFFTCANFLSYGGSLRVVRAYAGATTRSATSDPTDDVLIKNSDEYFNTYYSTGSNASLVSAWASRYPGAKGNSLKVEVWANSDATHFSSWAYASNFTSAPGTSVYANNIVAGCNDEIHIVVVDEDGAFTGTKNTVLEVYPFLSKASDARDDQGNSNYYKDVIYRKSNYVFAIDPQDASNTYATWGKTVSTVNGQFAQVANASILYRSSLSNGADGTIASGNVSLAYDVLADAEKVDISLLMTGDSSVATVGHVIDIAESRKDCVAFVSPPLTQTQSTTAANDIVSWRNNTLTKSTSYAVMDSGWKYQYDKYNDIYRWIPLNGDVAGLCARTDSVRDPWFSPAGLTRGAIKNVVKLAFNPSKTDRDTLYKNGVNPVVSFPGEGILLFGDKTLLSKPSAFDRINVRRLFITLEKAIAKAARAQLFEFNDEFTRAQFLAIVEPFLRDVKGRRGVTDYKVVCDTTNNTPQVIDNNQFVGDIYIKPARSINFIQLNFVAVRTGVSFDEVVGKF